MGEALRQVHDGRPRTEEMLLLLRYMVKRKSPRETTQTKVTR